MATISPRQFRYEPVYLGAGLASIGLLAVITGLAMSNQYHQSGLADCLSTQPRVECGALVDGFENRFASLQILILPLVLLPGLAGAFVGGPLVARELEAGTHRFLWTQALTPRRWFAIATGYATGLVGVAGLILAAISAVWLDVANRVTGERFDQLYDLQGVVPVAASILAVATGIACGVLVRRTVPAIVATVGVFVGIRLALAVLVRPRLAEPITIRYPFGTANPLDGTGAWQLSNQAVADDGTVLGADGSIDLTPVADRCPGIPADPGRGLPDFDAIRSLHRQPPGPNGARLSPGRSLLDVPARGVGPPRRPGAGHADSGSADTPPTSGLAKRSAPAVEPGTGVWCGVLADSPYSRDCGPVALADPPDAGGLKAHEAVVALTVERAYVERVPPGNGCLLAVSRASGDRFVMGPRRHWFGRDLRLYGPSWSSWRLR